MFEFIGYIVCYLVACWAVGVWASAWNRGKTIHIAISVLLTPVVGALTLMFSGKRIVYETDTKPESQVDVVIPDNVVVPMVKVDNDVVTPEVAPVEPAVVHVEPEQQVEPVVVAPKVEKKLTPSQKKQRDYKSRKQQKNDKKSKKVTPTPPSTQSNNLSSTSATHTTPLYTNDYYDSSSYSSSSTRSYGGSCSSDSSSYDSGSSSSDSGSSSSCD